MSKHKPPTIALPDFEEDEEKLVRETISALYAKSATATCWKSLNRHAARRANNAHVDLLNVIVDLNEFADALKVPAQSIDTMSGMAMGYINNVPALQDIAGHRLIVWGTKLAQAEVMTWPGDVGKATNIAFQLGDMMAFIKDYTDTLIVAAPAAQKKHASVSESESASMVEQAREEVLGSMAEVRDDLNYTPKAEALKKTMKAIFPMRPSSLRAIDDLLNGVPAIKTARNYVLH